MKKIILPAFLAILTGICAPVHAQLISTFAGDTASGDSGFGGPATAARFKSPSGILADAKGNIYISDYSTSRVTRVDASGIITNIAGTGITADTIDGIQASAASLNVPIGMTIDAAGNMYICEAGGNRVRKVDIHGVITTFAGVGGPYPMVTGDNGPATSAFLNMPSSIVFDKSGNAYIAENGRIRKVNTAGVITTFAGGSELAGSLGALNLILDESGTFYFSTNMMVKKIDPSGVISTIAGGGTMMGLNIGDGGPATAANFNEIDGLAIDRKGNIYIADTYHSRVRMVNTSGLISTIAGNGINGYSGDGGYADHAQIGNPTAITFDAKGNLYICDERNPSVRKVNYDVFTATQLTERKAGGLALSPNPCNGSFNINIASANNEQANITVMNIAGQRVQELTATTNTNVSLALDVPTGNYFLIATTATGRWMQQLAIQ